MSSSFARYLDAGRCKGSHGGVKTEPELMVCSGNGLDEVEQ